MKIFKYAAIWLLLAGCLISCKKEDEIPEDAYIDIVSIFKSDLCGIELCVWSGDHLYLDHPTRVPESLSDKYIIEADRHEKTTGKPYRIKIIYHFTGKGCHENPIINIIKIEKI